MASIFDVTAINRKFAEKPISFRLSFGHKPDTEKSSEMAAATTNQYKLKKLIRTIIPLQLKI